MKNFLPLFVIMISACSAANEDPGSSSSGAAGSQSVTAGSGVGGSRAAAGAGNGSGTGGASGAFGAAGGSGQVAGSGGATNVAGSFGTGGTSFGGTSFGGTSFGGTSFGGASFGGASFGGASFGGSAGHGGASFGGASFGGSAGHGVAGSGGTSNGGHGGTGSAGLGNGGGSGGTSAQVCTSKKTWTSGNGPDMRPGNDCRSCHSNFVIAGTVYPTLNEPNNCDGTGAGGVKVVITGADNTTLTLTPSTTSGNFYSTQSVKTPYSVKLTNSAGASRSMTAHQTAGNCNSCHSSSGTNGAPGRIMAP